MELSRRQLAVYVALALVVVAVGVRYLVTTKGASAGAQAATFALPSAAPSAASPSPSSTPAVVVYVCGAVRRPGVYTLPAGARVADLVARAGGVTGGAQLDTVNLAAKVTDGQQVVVPTKSAAGAAAAAPAPGSSSSASSAGPAAPVNLNTATLEELDTLPGVGPSTAQKIVDYRTQHGSFTSVDQLKEVSGIGDVRFAALKDLVTI